MRRIRRASLPARRLTATWLLAFLQRRVVPGIEEVIPGGYRRSLALPHGPGVVDLVPRADHVEATFVLARRSRPRRAPPTRCRRLLDLDRDPAPIAAHLGADLVIGHARRPRRRADGCRATPTGASWRCAPCWASRCR